MGGGRAYEKKGPWDFVVSVRKVVDEVEHDCRDDKGGEELAESDEVEGEYGVVRRLLLDFASRHAVDKIKPDSFQNVQGGFSRIKSLC